MLRRPHHHAPQHNSRHNRESQTTEQSRQVVRKSSFSKSRTGFGRLRVRSYSPASVLWLSLFCVVLIVALINLGKILMKHTGRATTKGVRFVSTGTTDLLDAFPERMPKYPTMVHVPMGKYGSNLSIATKYPLDHRVELPHRDVGYEYFVPYRDRGQYKSRSELEKEGCELLGDWQGHHNPNCVTFHEIDLNMFFVEKYDEPRHVVKGEEENLRFINNGAYRDVWMVRDSDNSKLALKMLRWSKKREYDPRNYERHRKDAVAMEQLTASPYIVNIMGFCGNSAVFDFADGGDLYDLYGQDVVPPTKSETIRLAHRVASAIADAHHLDSQGRATIAHTDIKPDQFITVNGEYQLNDFNRARFLTWDKEKNEHCGFYVGKNAGQWRSPEEYFYDTETEKVDVYSMGNVLYFLLTGGKTTFHPKEKQAPNYVKSGVRPHINTSITESTDVYDVAMVKAINMCWEHDKKLRTGAREVAIVLKDAIDKMEEERRNA